MTDERKDLAQEDDQLPVLNKPTKPTIVSPVSMSIESGDLRGTVFVHGNYQGYRVTLELYVNDSVKPIDTRYVHHASNGNNPFLVGSFIPGEARLKAWGTVNGVDSDPVEVKFYISAKPLILTPGEDEIVSDRRPVISGAGGGSCSLRVKNSGSSEVLSESFFAIAGLWSVKLNRDLLDNTDYSIFIEQSKPGYTTRKSDPRKFITRLVTEPPVITSPAAGSLQETTFTVGGSRGEVGATVHVLLDLVDPPVEVGKSAVLTGAAWMASVKVEPGPVLLVAKQVKGQVESGRSVAVDFKIRPPAFTAVNVEYPTETSVKFSGTGHTGATVEITVISGPDGTAPPSALVTSGSWNTTATNWKFGTYTLKAIQKVSDKASGWIESQPYTFSVRKVFPDPTDVTFTTDYQPTFSGKGYTGATVVLFNQGGSKVAPDARVSSGRWSSMASEVWGPTWKRRVQLRQELGGQTSEGWVEIEVSIAPLAPVITDITGIDDGQHSPTFKGTCWGGAQVTLRFSDNAQTHQATVSGNQWTFRRSTPFAVDITHTVTVTQYSAGQDSPAATRAFSLERFIPQPVFTAPAAGSEVGHNLLVKGRGGIAGGKIELHDAQFGGLVGASDSLIADGDWEVQLNNLAFRDFTLIAQQVMGERKSEPSAEHSFKVVVFPPEIEVPGLNGALPRNARISGKGLPGATVDVWLQGVAEPILTGIGVGTNGLWQREAVTLEIGRHSLWARQTFQGLPSKDTPAQAFGVVPLAPTIETPVDAVPVGRGVMVSGFGHPGDTVAVALSTAPQTALGRAPVLADRTWSVAVELVVAAGDHDLIAIASSGEFHSDASLPRKVRVGPYLPSIDVPAPSRWVTDPVAFAGKGQPGVGELVSWFNPERVVARDIPVTANGWQIDATIRLPQGGYWVRFRQVIGSGGSAIHSDWADSRRFEVVPSPSGISRY
jgi:hypothetical protein